MQRSPVPLEDELEFTKQRIDANFSNYSSWHYRSRLLPELFPGEEASTIKEEILLQELDLVLNAGFTDPQDQSAWMYHRWLLGKGRWNCDIAFTLFKTIGCLQTYFANDFSMKLLKVSAFSYDSLMQYADTEDVN